MEYLQSFENLKSENVEEQVQKLFFKNKKLIELAEELRIILNINKLSFNIINDVSNVEMMVRGGYELSSMSYTSSIKYATKLNNRQIGIMAGTINVNELKGQSIDSIFLTNQQKRMKIISFEQQNYLFQTEQKNTFNGRKIIKNYKSGKDVTMEAVLYLGLYS